ncbi:HET-domain-containing protein [Durotheca rogersii]|uniref:HET-domain-containing protein n=1 Tax=Durotheca rogersii TaxID=419775 RepID=UPI002220085D|nr:HET-domain-containing protein [Durotheca rogersii]KAI5856157.1 HET-domain-containing protein [Durotheca rogersii]
MEPCATCCDLELRPGPSGGFVTGGSGHELERSGSTCQLCSILWEGLKHFGSGKAAEAQWVVFRQHDSPFRLQYRWSSEGQDWLGLHFYTKDQQDPLSAIFVPNRDLTTYTGNATYLAQMQGWVNSCLQDHSVCKERRSKYLPTRLLDVSRETDTIFLFESAGRDEGPYMALSHCWGGTAPLVTTDNSLERFKQGIAIDRFPKTFRDAIAVTRELGCRYLWIDSLCIIQDNPDDWRHEAARMKDVYGNAYVTIAAAASASSHGGLLYRHDKHDIGCTVERQGEDGRKISIHVRLALEHSAYFNALPCTSEAREAAPLLERCWCLQEYLLSPRVLMFTRWELFWVCDSIRACSCGEYGESTREMASAGGIKPRFDQLVRHPSSTAALFLWKDVLQMYLQKQLTHDKDRLPALAGIAQVFSTMGLGRYVNGLWGSFIVSQLFWRAASTHGGGFSVVARRSTDTSMPSWTWASVFGSFNCIIGGSAYEGIDAVDVSYEPGATKPFADVCAKTLIIRGLLAEARAWGGGEPTWNPARRYRLIRAPDAPEYSWLVDVASEMTGCASSPMKVYILSGTKPGRPGLVLRRVEGTNDTYRRLGVVENCSHSQDGLDFTEIKLV